MKDWSPITGSIWFESLQLKVVQPITKPKGQLLFQISTLHVDFFGNIPWCYLYTAATSLMFSDKLCKKIRNSKRAKIFFFYRTIPLNNFYGTSLLSSNAKGNSMLIPTAFQFLIFLLTSFWNPLLFPLLFWIFISVMCLTFLSFLKITENAW